MPRETEQLIIALEAKVADFEKGMARAAKAVDRKMRDIESAMAKGEKAIEASTSRMNAVFAGIGGKIKGAAAGALAGLGIVEMLKKTTEGAREAVKTFAELGERANSIGFSTDGLQAVQLALETAGASADDIVGAMAQFSGVRSELIREGGGALADALGKTNKELLKQIQLAPDNEAAFRLILNAMRDAKTEAERTAIAMAAFGEDDAIKMLRAFRDGAATIDQFLQKAREMGVLIDRDLIERSRQLDDQMQILQRSIDLNFKQALVDLGPAIIQALELLNSLAGVVRDVADAFRSFDTMSARGQQAAVDAARSRVEDVRRRVAESERFRDAGGAILAPPGYVPKELADREIAAAEKELADLTRQQYERAEKGFFPPSMPGKKPPPAGIKTGGGLTKGSGEFNDETAKKVKELVEQYRKQGEELHLTGQALAEYRAASQLSSEATEEDIAKVKAAAAAYYQLAEAARVAGDVADAIGSALDKALPDLLQGKADIRSMFEDLAMDLAQIAWKEAITDPIRDAVKGALMSLRTLNNAAPGVPGGGGWLSSLISAFVGGTGFQGHATPVSPSALATMTPGGLYAGGGRPPVGRLSVVGEEGPEWFLPRGAGTVIPAPVTAALQAINSATASLGRAVSDIDAAGGGMGGGGGSRPLQVVVNNNAGADVQAQQRSTPQGDILEIVVDRVKGEMGRGRFDDVMGARYSARPATRKIGR